MVERRSSADLAAEPTADLAADLARRARGLLILGCTLVDGPGASWLAALDALALGDGPAAERAYAGLFGSLADEAVAGSLRPGADLWRAHVADRLLIDDNPLSRWASVRRAEPIPAWLLAAAGRDLVSLEGVALADTAWLGARIGEMTGVSPASAGETESTRPAVSDLRGLLTCGSDWLSNLAALTDYYAAHGAGLFARYRAFRWVREGGVGHLRGIANPDPITLDELVGYDPERTLLLRNTEHFVAGQPANNVLIYGDRGTGKSSTVKALLNAGAESALRLIEVAKSQLIDFPEILATLRGRPERFILFVDDLSFDEHETEYKALKAILEGGIEARPTNVVLYATSNRRHLVQESFADRPSFAGALTASAEEIHPWDTTQEKLSLADRFGITIRFFEPDQDRYLRIVEALAARAGVTMPAEELQRQALQWARWHNGRSGRRARQLVDFLVGEAGIGSGPTEWR